MIHVTPLPHLAETLRESRAMHLIAISSPGKELGRPAQIAESGWLFLSMNDIVDERERLVAPSHSHVGAVIDFARNWDRQAPLIVSCYAGISRSTAVAYIVTCLLQPEQGELDLAQTLRRLSPSATPNPRIVALADEMMGRQGRMIAAIRSIGRGREAFSGKPFTFDLQDREIQPPAC
ncbi:protein-tyrosine-phosphatase [Nitratireductor aestuarii]|uniref:Protein-tyrosine-phosphatase n=1 Tax=Nitratireductor aestuarii TaxID=1735103 RepID=A0A916S3C3_9HYPH|nr:tyrosine phosphatase family protein [Nitratireductor aestuarii]GGA79454.1 protein-tyrosine-phosphatase [Nitratireductor aestuarii]